MALDESQLEKLIALIVALVTERDSYVSKTKLLKLLYLFDVEYFRVHRRTFTGLSWKFFHLGPWATEYDPIIEGILARNVLLELETQKGGRIFKCAKPPGGSAFTSLREEAILREVLKVWGTAETADILDHVYFHSEPMQSAVRSQAIDFTSIGNEPPVKYVRSSSGKSPKEIAALRNAFKAKKSVQELKTRDFTFTPPVYDEEYADAMEKLETA